MTEDKASSSHVVVPIPASLEEGKASNTVQCVVVDLIQSNALMDLFYFHLLLQRSGCVL